MDEEETKQNAQCLLPGASSSILSYRVVFGLWVSLWYWFLMVFKPSEAYLVQFLIDDKGFSSEQVYQDIFPMWTYSYFAFVVILALIAEFVSYKHVIVVGSFAMWLACLLLLIPSNFTSNTSYLYVMYADQWLEGLGSASGIVFSSYLYFLVPESYFIKITSYSRSVQLLSSIISAFLGTFMVTFISLVSAVWGTMIALSIGMILSFFLVNVSHKPGYTLKSNMKDVFAALRNWMNLKWLLWSAAFLAIHQLALVYIQSIWENEGGSTDLNGIFYGIAYGCSAVTTLIPSRFSSQLMYNIAPIGFIVMPVIMGLLLVFLGLTANLYASYIVFALYHCSFEFMYPVSNSIMALEIAQTSNYAVIFSIKTFLALTIQSVVQFVVGKNVLDLNIQQMFVSFGFLCFLGCFLAFLSICIEFIYRRYNKRNTNVNIQEDNASDCDRVL